MCVETRLFDQRFLYYTEQNAAIKIHLITCTKIYEILLRKKSDRDIIHSFEHTHLAISIVTPLCNHIALMTSSTFLGCTFKFGFLHQLQFFNQSRWGKEAVEIERKSIKLFVATVTFKTSEFGPPRHSSVF